MLVLRIGFGACSSRADRYIISMATDATRARVRIPEPRSCGECSAEFKEPCEGYESSEEGRLIGLRGEMTRSLEIGVGRAQDEGESRNRL